MMKMKECTQQDFEKVISNLEEYSYTISSDVGRTHAINVYQRMGGCGRLFVIGSSSWIKEDRDRVWSYEIANYLYETYVK